MKTGDVYIIKGNTLAYPYYCGNPFIVDRCNSKSDDLYGTLYMMNDKKISHNVYLFGQNIQYIGSDDIINYINIL